MNRIHSRDKRKWFAAHFGRSYFQSPVLVSPVVVIGLAAPFILLMAIAAFAFSHASSGVALAIAPILIASDRVQDFTRRIGDAMTEYEGIQAKAAAEQRMLTEEERTRCGVLQKQVKDLTAERGIVQDEIEVRELINQPLRPPTRPVVQSEDELQRRYPGLPPKDKRFSSIGEMVSAVIKAEPRVGGNVDPRLMRTASGMGESSPTDGGFAVQPDFAARLIEPLFDQKSGDAVLSRINKTTVSGNGLTFNAIDETDRSTTNWGGIAMYWLGEGSDKTASQPKLRKVELKLKKIAGLCYLTDELMEDAPALSGRLEAGFQVALRSALIKAIIKGTGSGQPLGLLNSKAKIKIAKETGQEADTIVTENIVNMYSQLDPNAQSPVWLYNRTCFKQLFQLQIGLGTAGALINLPNGGIAVAPNSTLLGLPLIPVPWCSALGDEGDIILTDLGQYEFISKGGPNVAYSIHVRFIYDETAMRIVYRCDGQPAVVSYTTLEDGVTTVSPIITLADRS